MAQIAKILAPFAVVALLFATALPGPAGAAERPRGAGIEKLDASTEVSDARRRYRHRHRYVRHYWGPRRYYRPYAYYYPRPYYYRPYYAYAPAPFPFFPFLFPW